jgi:uncharacterized protein YndB with AHSA1/START domain
MAVKFDQHIDIDAPPDTVWGIITDPNTWARWFPDMEQLTNVSAVESGGTFQWSSGGEAGTGSIASLDPAADRLKVFTQLGESQVTHTFDVDRSGGFLGLGGNDARLRYTMEYDPPGGFLSDFVAGGNPKDLLKVKQTLEKVKALAEGR